MASLRRTLSPVPRQGTLSTVEADHSVPSLLSKYSSCNEKYPPTAGLVSSFFGLSDSRASILGIFGPKSGRIFDRSKLKGKVWTRVLLHFFICFIVGLLIGLTPFISMDFSYMNSGSKPQAFGNFRNLGSSERNVTLVTDNKGIENNVGTNQSLARDKDPETRKLLIIVTPTYAGPLQAYYLSRLGYTLKLAEPPLLWIVVEMNSQSEETADILRRSGVMYRHLVCKKNLTDIKDRHAHQRNVALSHIETHQLDGIVYFANEDNIYSIDLFQQMRHIRRFGTWTVAKQTWDKSGAIMEGPVCNGTQVIGWHLNRLSRRFRSLHGEMSWFAFNSTILWDPKRWNRRTLEPIRQLDTVKDGFQASSFIEQLVDDYSQMEGLPPDCSRIMVWMLNVESSDSFYPKKWSVKNNLDVIAPLA
ncbi:IRREGULAR XYLEM 9-LIKE, IRREGULAR XYLEM 9 Homolog [Hibiscus trionum]|uniref:Glycosyltransferases n=1 Tax=Hibiscus trionum TaxID=183268 RepID=A0A9W7MVK6_HIBTR|nr:IRREGULAR XYLEM 9-LIKE, IRREGULAR XYLEM 9 Homolog [Hibiscus trionum]